MVPRCSDFFPVWGGMLIQLLGLRCKLEVFDGSEGLSLRNLLNWSLYRHLLLFRATLGRSCAVVLVEGHFLIQINSVKCI